MISRKIKYELYQLGWHSFQQLCIQITRTILSQTIESFLETNDGGKDGAFKGIWKPQGTETYSGKFIIQCKHTSRKDEKLGLSVLSDEITKAKKLVDAGECDIYVLITNYGISGATKTKIEKAFTDVGIKHLLIFGSDWICEQIALHRSLRTSVPRLYGLGDLSQILDERAYSQARALVETIRYDLGKVVITGAYRKAQEALNQHGFVLLVGEPAAGKTTIAYMLAMAAMDSWGAQLVAAETADKMIEHWNTDSKESQLFWIDDAFGVTQYEYSLAQQWNRALPKIQSMLKQGIKIVMTSRNYIYARARNDLKTSAFPLFHESQVVVDVHNLTPDERKQILYNHLKLGKQPKEYLAEIKPLLLGVASHPRFIPEVARRLSDPIFTTDVYLSKYHLDEFIEKQEQFLMEVIEKLDVSSKAALGLIYMRSGRLESPIKLTDLENEAVAKMGGSIKSCIDSLNALKDTLVTLSFQDDLYVWRFKHPTIGDAFSKVVVKDTELLDIFLKGSSTEELVTQITCGNLGIEKAVVIGKNYFPEIRTRLKNFKASSRFKGLSLASWGARDAVDTFLSTRCSKEFLESYVIEYPEVLDRVSKPSLYLSYSSEVRLAKKLFAFGLMPDNCRLDFVNTLKEYAVNGYDMFALEDDDVRKMFTDEEFQQLKVEVIDKLVPNLDSVREKMQREIDSHSDPEDGMDSFFEMLKLIGEIGPSDPVLTDILAKQENEAREWIEQEIAQRPDDIDSRDFDKMEEPIVKESERSIFDDIDA